MDVSQRFEDTSHPLQKYQVDFDKHFFIYRLIIFNKNMATIIKNLIFGIKKHESPKIYFIITIINRCFINRFCSYARK